MADCVGVGWLQNFRFRNFAKFSQIFSFVAKFSLNFSNFSLKFAKFKIILSKFHETRNFDKIILNFMKFKENFAKHEIKNFKN